MERKYLVKESYFIEDIIYELVDGFMKRGEFGFEEITYLFTIWKTAG